MPRTQKTLAERKAELKAQLKEIEEIEKKEREEKCQIIGQAIFEAIEKDKNVRTTIDPILNEYVVGKKQRILLGLTVPEKTESI